MLMLMEDIVEGRATMETIDTLEALAVAIQKGSLCALGKTAPNPVLSVLKHFREEMIEHVVDKKCRTHKCAALSPYAIDPVKCKRCGSCARKCPVQAIRGDRDHDYVIDETICVRCGTCKQACKFGAVEGA